MTRTSNEAQINSVSKVQEIKKESPNNAKIIDTIRKNLLALDQKKMDYAKKYTQKPYQEACHAAQRIQFTLEGFLKQYDSEKDYTLKNFKEDAMKFINSIEFKNDLKILNTPRKFQTKAIVLNLMFSLSTLLVVGFTAKKCFTGTFFFHLNTDGANKVDALKNVILSPLK